ncbi:XPG domain-containing protein [Perkinsela sp. CCAP 1560/4]|nr:XPG domain-containing protein [Perkinsela sp. CCAP 1560/4]|eukprot:KNH08329.1 XPG domain-containing protein [Perkinsela sp. CCAP 1560/4]
MKSTKSFSSLRKHLPKIVRDGQNEGFSENVSDHRAPRRKPHDSEMKDASGMESEYSKKDVHGRVRNNVTRRKKLSQPKPMGDSAGSSTHKKMTESRFEDKMKKDSPHMALQADKFSDAHHVPETTASKKSTLSKNQRRPLPASTGTLRKDAEIIPDEEPKSDMIQTIDDYEDCFFLKDIQKDVRQLKADFLDGTVLGIDVRYWLRRLEPHRKSLFQFNKRYEIGEKNCITKNILLQELLRFRDLNVTVLLVFNGIDRDGVAALKEASSPTSVLPEGDAHTPKDARKRITHSTCARAACFEHESVINELLEICWEYRTSILSHVQFVRAPGDALPQLSYYHRVSLVANVFGPPWLFWAEAHVPSRIILDIQDDIVYFTERTAKIEAITAKTPIDPVILREDGQLCGVPKPPAFPTETMLLHLAIGLLSPSLLDAALTLRIVDQRPRFDSREIRCVLESILPLRAQLIRMLLKGHRTHSQVRWVRWYAEEKPAEIALPPAIDLDEWGLEGTEFPHPPNFISAIELIHHKTYTRNPYVGLIQYSHALHLKFLDVLGYFVYRDIRDGRQMFSRCERGVFSEAILHTHPIFAESMVLFIEFVRTKSLGWTPVQNAKNFSFFESPFRFQSSSGQSGPDEFEAVALSRLFSFVPIEFEDDMLTYQDVASDDLKAFWEILQTMRGTLLNVSEVIAVVELPIVELPESLVHEAFGYLPFKRVASPFLGAVMEHILVISRSAAFQEKTREEKIHYLKSKFPHIKNLPYFISVGFQWVEEVLRVVQHLFEFMEDEEPQSTKQYVCHLLKMLRQTKFYADKIKQQIFD